MYDRSKTREAMDGADLSLGSTMVKGFAERSKFSSWVSPSSRPWEREASLQSARERERREAMPPIAWIVPESISERGLDDKSKLCSLPSWPKMSGGSE